MSHSTGQPFAPVESDLACPDQPRPCSPCPEPYLNTASPRSTLALSPPPNHESSPPALREPLFWRSSSELSTFSSTWRDPSLPAGTVDRDFATGYARMRAEGRVPLRFDHIAIPGNPECGGKLRLEVRGREEIDRDTIYVSRSREIVPQDRSGPLRCQPSSSARLMIVIPRLNSARRAVKKSV